MHRQPALGRLLVAVRVVTRLVEDRDAHAAVLLDVGVRHLGDKHHFRRAVGILSREVEVSLEETTLEQCVRWSDDQHLPLQYVIVVDQFGREAADRVLLSS